MFARVTQVEIDGMRISTKDAVALFEQQVLPRLRNELGYRGVLVLTAADGKAVLVSLWESDEQARTQAPFYETEISKYLTLFRSPPGREAYAVTLLDGAAL